MKNKITVNKNGIGFIGLLTIAFIVLKLCNVVSWSWFWILSPMIFFSAFVGVLLLIFVASSLVYAYAVKKQEELLKKMEELKKNSQEN